MDNSFLFLALYIFESGEIPIGMSKYSIILSVLLLMFMIGTEVITVAFFKNQVIDITTPKQRAITLLLNLSIIFFFCSFLHYFV